jgi:hypothetical protein
MSFVGVAALAVCPAARAAPVAIANPGFEMKTLADGDYDWQMDGQGWGYADNGGNLGPWNPTTADYPGEAPEGLNVGWTEPGDGVPGGFAQVLTATLVSSMTYTLTVKVGNALTYAYPGYAVQLLAGGTMGSSGDGYADPITGGFLLAQDNNSQTVADGTFVTSTVVYTYDPAHSAHLGEPLQIRLLALAGGGEVEFDDVRLDAVPEPASLALLGLGALAVIRRRRQE